MHNNLIELCLITFVLWGSFSNSSRSQARHFWHFNFSTAAELYIYANTFHKQIIKLILCKLSSQIDYLSINFTKLLPQTFYFSFSHYEWHNSFFGISSVFFVGCLDEQVKVLEYKELFTITLLCTKDDSYYLIFWKYISSCTLFFAL